MKVIIHPSQEHTGIVFLIPAGVIPVEEVARKDVPAGVPFKIINHSDLPTDMDFRDAWEADFSEPDGYGIGNEAWFAEQEQK